MTGDLAVIGTTLVSLALIGRDVYLGRKVADRARLVPPPKAPRQPAEPAAQTAPLKEVA